MAGFYGMDDRLVLAESILGFEFTNKALGLEALMLAGGAYGGKGVVEYQGRLWYVEKNTKLAVVGDRMLAAVLSEAWFSTGTEKVQETRLREALTDNAVLNKRGKALGLDRCVMLNAGHAPHDVSVRSMATTVEALIGAVHLDMGGGGAGIEMVRQVMEHMGFFEHELFQTMGGID